MGGTHIPDISLLWAKESQLTGVTVVSNHPQSTTIPVTRPQAARARRLEGVKAMLGAWG